MRAALFAGLGGPSNIEVRELDDPQPGPDEVVLDVEASSINHHDYWYLQGKSRIDENDLPFLSGVDVAGVVRELGSDVTSVDIGDRVVLNPMETCGSCEYCRDRPENLCEEYGLFHGGFAEQAAVPADRLLPLPESVSMTEAAALPVAYMTAWHMIRRAELSPGDSVLVPGATGGIGVAATQLLDRIGVTVVGTSSSAEKVERLESIGVDHGVVVAEAAALPDATAEYGRYEAVLNHLAGDYTEAALSVMDTDARMVICGATAGSNSEFDPWDLFLRHKRIIGSTMGTQRDLRRVVSLVGDGSFSPVIEAEYPLAETEQAFADLRDRDQFGKLIIKPQADS